MLQKESFFRRNDPAPARGLMPPAPAPTPQLSQPAAQVSYDAPKAAPKSEERKEAKLVVGPDIKMKGVEVNDCDTLQVEGRIEATLDARVLHIAEKGVFSGIRIEVDRGNGQWVFLDVDLKPHYTDNASPAPGTTALWKYRAIYLQGDQVFGQWSDPVSIAVHG